MIFSVTQVLIAQFPKAEWCTWELAAMSLISGIQKVCLLLKDSSEPDCILQVKVIYTVYLTCSDMVDCLM